MGTGINMVTSGTVLKYIYCLLSFWLFFLAWARKEQNKKHQHNLHETNAGVWNKAQGTNMLAVNYRHSTSF